jgi:F-type H+-transporting ATPase subunit delta
MPKPSRTVEKHAEALMALAAATDSVARIDAQMTSVLELIDSNEDLKIFLSSQGVQPAGKRATLEELLQGRIDGVLLYFILILQEQGLISELDQVVRAFSNKASLLERRVTGQLLSAVPLHPSKVSRIEQEVGRVLGKEVRLHPKVSPLILGGISVHVGDFVINGTIDNDLERMGRELLT